ncbi:hypothetical protein, partial [Flavobacterium sp. H122]|uniref:hypothetical protein n=1 Tax=Flavobacterium sp. H122 TaxID=2529860 RepID=UPI001B7D883C
MEKFILLNKKGKGRLLSSFSCCRSKKLLQFVFSFFVLLTGNSAFSQLVGDATVKANFGVEADVYANQLQFPNSDIPPVPLPSAIGTDDWFVDPILFPGSGKGVIDQSNAAAIEATILATPKYNYAFELRQSVTTPTFPFPYPIVDGYLWLDSVYGRDNISGQGENDLSIFSGTKDKNSDNPNTWNLGIGSIPQKDDIVDVYAHLRGEGPKEPTGLDPRPFTTLWAFAGGSLRDT